MEHFRRELTKHVGGNPSIVEVALIERCCWLQLRMAMLDKKIASGRDFTQIDSNTYLAWNNKPDTNPARLVLHLPSHAATSR